jgi:radical SAM superfamily enzyme YgiQ (UPF0313 family)
MVDMTLVLFNTDSYEAPGVSYLTYGLKKEGIDFELKLYSSDNRESKLILDDLYNFLADSGKIIALGCMSNMLPYVICVLKKIKKRYPEKVIILGGPGPSVSAEEILLKFRFVDFVIKGDGTFSLPNLVKIIQNGKTSMNDVTGLVYRTKNIIISNDFNRYPDENIIPIHPPVVSGSIYYVVINTSWGCPYNCTYCDSRPLVGKKMIYKPLSIVMDEIKSIKCLTKNNHIRFMIGDEAFVVNRERVVEWCNLLKALKLKIEWTCFGRINAMDEELVKMMSEQGCKGIFYGVESGSNRVLGKIRKGFSIEEAFKILLLSKKYLPITAAFIYRYPFETYEDFKETLLALKYLRWNGIDWRLYPLSPVKGTDMYEQYKESIRFSIHEPCERAINDNLKLLPDECISLIKSNQEIFYDYFYYSSEELPKIMRALEFLSLD